ncbi:hypothetical protein PsYK624_045920 [Phanerochaete sordida]|uniref:Transmembrane protein n=1 Tax=Phanerochaete sordida TaxID=48140 RepID=A0A9P3LBF5_9APHY|nr:hypothetical protein PsYK624_045920 [Phanerochaete sordida]
MSTKPTAEDVQRLIDSEEILNTAGLFVPSLSYSLLECFLFGILTMLMIQAIRAYRRGRKDKTGTAPGKWVIAACGVTYVLALVHISLYLRALYIFDGVSRALDSRLESCASAFLGNLEYFGSCEDDFSLGPALNLLPLFETILVSLAALLMNVILFERAWVLGPRRRILHVISVSLFAASMVSSIVLTVMGALTNLRWFLLGVALPLIFNIWATILMYWSLWQHSFSVAWELRNQQFWSRAVALVALFMEPGLLYVGLWLLILPPIFMGASATSKMKGLFTVMLSLVNSALIQLIGIYAAMLVVLSRSKAQSLYVGGSHVRPLGYRMDTSRDSTAAGFTSTPRPKNEYSPVTPEDADFDKRRFSFV